jgi:hypothetical protein
VYVGGHHDPGSRTVTVDVDRLGLYTLAPSMPAGAIALEAAAADGRWSFTASGLRTNDGKAVPDGTPFTVAAVVPKLVLGGNTKGAAAGAFVTPDAAPAEPGQQILSRGGGLAFELRAVKPPVKVIVFAVAGTALGTYEIR